MSDEYFAPLEPGVLPAISTLPAALGNRAGVMTLRQSENAIALRWGGQTPRDRWPEDIEISRTSEGVLVSIHIATAMQRAEFIERLTEAVRELTGQAVEFQEL
jgi:hypothetical protein